MCYYGNGYTFSDVYKMPVHIRVFHYKKLAEAKKKEKQDTDKALKKPSSLRLCFLAISFTTFLVSFVNFIVFSPSWILLYKYKYKVKKK